jgi:cystathionine beta-lyase/cystathionine gamma-synthase
MDACRTAEKLADAMAQEVGVSQVIYPGRRDHPDADKVGRVMPGPHGAMLTLVLEGGDARALQVLRQLEVATEATSLGGVESLASVPFNSSHFNMTPQERLDAGILPGMLRLSIGLEGEQALFDDLRRALRAAV